MDLKTMNTSVTSNIGNFEGSVLELVVFLRRRAISDLIRMVETQLVYSSEFYEDASTTYTKDVYITGKEERMEIDIEEQIALDDVVEPVIPQKIADILDTTLGSKIVTFSNVITFFDNIIKADGIVDTGSAQDMINKFKELDGVFGSYGTFTISDTYRTV